MSASGRGPGVDIPPPALFAVAYLAAWLLDRKVMHLWPELPHGSEPGVKVLGWTLVITGVSLGVWGVQTFNKLRTPVYPNRDARLLVIEGPYRFSRNPMYTGIIIACLGGCAVITSLWPIVTVAVAIGVLYFYVIRREERHLTEAFGDDYREYQRHVGRWFTF
jgi:protein-S-isoprenylcysteine O-methyltransferase Ste14